MSVEYVWNTWYMVNSHGTHKKFNKCLKTLTFYGYKTIINDNQKMFTNTFNELSKRAMDTDRF